MDMPFLGLATSGAFHLTSGLNWTSSAIYSEQIKTCMDWIKQSPQCRPLTNFQTTLTAGTLANPRVELKDEQEGIFTYEAAGSQSWTAAVVTVQWPWGDTLNGGGGLRSPMVRVAALGIFWLKLSLSGSLVASGLGYWGMCLRYNYLQWKRL